MFTLTALPQKSSFLFLMGGFIIAVVVGVTYFFALAIGFWSDDYAFIETAARFPLWDYLVWYFDPRVQALWYRPIPGLLWWMEWQFFHGNPAPYHLTYVLIHLANCLLLYALVVRVTRQWVTGFISAVVYAGFEVYSLAVLRPSDETALAALFYFSGVLLWLNYLKTNSLRNYLFAYLVFVLALFSKEASVTLIAMLFLVDRLLVGDQLDIKSLISRYAPFGLVLIPYLIFELTILPTTQYKTNLGYGFGTHIYSILGEYLNRIFFPWGSNPPFNSLWLLFACLGIGFFLYTRSDRRLLFLCLGLLSTLAPYVLFQFVFLRFLYLPMIFPSVAIGGICSWVVRKFAEREWLPMVVALGIGSIVLANGLMTFDQINWLDRFSREMRIPLRSISQRHPNLPDDTLLYFIDPQTPLYSGMFFLRYGSQVTVGGDIGIYNTVWRNVREKPAGLRDHRTAYVYYFDEPGELREVLVAKDDPTRISWPLPIEFENGIRLEGYEIASATVKHSEAIVILLYWRPARTMREDYSVFAHLLDHEGKILTGADTQPRNGKAPTHSWESNRLVVDWIILPIPSEVPSGFSYRLEFGFYDLSTMQRLGVLEANGSIQANRIIIEPFVVID